jgi:hypothetical protein
MIIPNFDAYEHSFVFFFSFGQTGFKLRALKLARQVLYHFSCAPEHPFLFQTYLDNKFRLERS